MPEQAHHGLESGHQAAGGMLNFDFSVRRAVVYVGLTIGKDDDLFAVQIAVENLLETFRAPAARGIFAIVCHASDEFADIAENRLKLLALRLCASSKHAAKLHTPTTARASGHKHGYAEGHDGENPKHDDKEGARRGFATIDVAKIVQEDHETDVLSLVPDGPDAHMHASGRQGGDGVPILKPVTAVGIGDAHARSDCPAAEVLRISGGGGSRQQVGIADRRSHDAFVAREIDQLLLKHLGVVIPGTREAFGNAHEDQLRA